MTVPPLPATACDTHMHFYNSAFPAASTTVLRPPDATVADYQQLQNNLGCRRVVVVQPTTYGLDNSCQLDAMAELRLLSDEDSIRGVAVVNNETKRSELERLHAQGVRGARFHMLPGGAVDWEQLEPVVAAIADFDWHIQLQLNGRELAERQQQLGSFTLVIDHIGRFMPPVDTDDKNFAALRRLLDSGKVWVKISAPYESSVDGPPTYDDTASLAEALLAEYPERMLWATNWPHPGQDNPPSPADLAKLVTAWIPAEHRQRILVDNPSLVYGFDQT